MLAVRDGRGDGRGTTGGARGGTGDARATFPRHVTARILGAWSRCGVLAGLLGGEAGGVGGAEVGPVAAEHLDPEAARLVEIVGDEVGGVLSPSSGHPDVGRSGAGVFANREVGLGDGVALGAVDGGGVGELDTPAHVVGVDHAVGSAVGEVEPIFGFDEGDGPGIAVGDPEVVVVSGLRR